MNYRIIALNWWNNLSSEEQLNICSNTPMLVRPTRNPETLTGREIEMLFYNNLKVPETWDTYGDFINLFNKINNVNFTIDIEKSNKETISLKNENGICVECSLSCTHEYEHDISCGVDIHVCKKCGDVL